jgi:DNA-binding transcriptional ArsR family regulator
VTTNGAGWPVSFADRIGSSGRDITNLSTLVSNGLQNPTEKLILHHMVKFIPSEMDRVFSALSDATRRGILQRLKTEPGLSISELARPFSVKLPNMMKHLDVLSNAGLITRTKTGRTVAVHLSADPMREALSWLTQYESLWTTSLDRFAALVERDGEA